MLILPLTFFTTPMLLVLRSNLLDEANRQMVITVLLLKNWHLYRMIENSL